MTMSTVTLQADTSIAKRHYQTSPAKASPSKKRKRLEEGERNGEVASDQPTTHKRRRNNSNADRCQVSLDSPVWLLTFTGTTSAKLSYLIDQVVMYQDDEKILIFYDGDDIAYYLAQYLDLLHITYLIYAKSLNSQQKSKYIVTFDENPHIRVLIMDVRCGAEGLNVNKASRVYFINPCYRPNIEAQAIKRSHRIGQTKAVHVETLILRGTIEEAMFKRARLMTESEHQQAKELADDKQFAHIIQNARSVPMTAEDFISGSKMAPLALPQQIFGRDGRGKSKIKGIDVDLPENQAETKPKRRRKSKHEVAGPSRQPILTTDTIVFVDEPANPQLNASADTPASASSHWPSYKAIFSLFGGS